MPNQPDPQHYRSFLLRLWQESTASAPTWRFSLEDPHTGERRGLANLDALIAFLKEAMNETKVGDSYSAIPNATDQSLLTTGQVDM